MSQTGARPVPEGSSPELALRLDGLRFRYPIALGLRRKEVLFGVDLALERGRFLGLVGPNGSGKSTLLRVLAGVERASAGRLEVLGAGPESAGIRRRIGFLPEDSPFPRELRALAAMELLGSLRGVNGVRAKARELLARVGLEREQRTPLARFSRGMLRRFGLAQALIHAPDLLLLDEPTAGLDAQGFDVLDGLLRKARERGATCVISSHLLSDVNSHCDRLAVLIDGRIRAAGEPEALLGERDSFGLEIEGLSREALDRLGAAVEADGGRVLSRGPTTRGLLALYRRCMGDEGGAGGDPD